MSNKLDQIGEEIGKGLDTLYQGDFHDTLRHNIELAYQANPDTAQEQAELAKLQHYQEVITQNPELAAGDAFDSELFAQQLHMILKYQTNYYQLTSTTDNIEFDADVHDHSILRDESKIIDFMRDHCPVTTPSNVYKAFSQYGLSKNHVHPDTYKAFCSEEEKEKAVNIPESEMPTPVPANEKTAPNQKPNNKNGEQGKKLPRPIVKKGIQIRLPQGIENALNNRKLSNILKPVINLNNALDNQSPHAIMSAASFLASEKVNISNGVMKFCGDNDKRIKQCHDFLNTVHKKGSDFLQNNNVLSEEQKKALEKALKAMQELSERLMKKLQMLMSPNKAPA
ncbi:hypothetical protein AB4254_11345 [Vibrio breoganii]